MKRNPMRTIIWGVLVGMALWSVSSGPSLSAGETWTNLNSSQFPAHVRAIVFANGNRIDSSGGVCWGKWCVNLGPNRPYAALAQCSPRPCLQFDIKNLQCKNPVLGTKNCTMSMGAIPGGYVPQCAVWIGDHIFNIKCPQHLRFE